MTFRLGRYFWKLFLINAALMALVLAACVWVIIARLDRLHARELTRQLTAQASTLEAVVRDRFDAGHAAELNALAREVGSTVTKGVRVTFVLADGTVLGDSEADPANMESHAGRPEIRRALARGWGESTRWSHTVAKNLKYVALRVGPPADPRGVVRVAMAMQSIGARRQPAHRMVAAITLVCGAGAVMLALGLALLWSRRLGRITETARSLSQGDLSARVDVAGHDEVAALGRSLNDMRERLSRHVKTIERQRRTLDSLVSQLREGVIVGDAAGRIILINSEAVRLLQISPPPSGTLVGSHIEQSIPQHRLQEMLRPRKRARATESPQAAPGGVDEKVETADEGAEEGEIQVDTPTGSVFLLARASNIRLPGDGSDDPADRARARRGRVVVVTDVTELTKMLRIKADLAANASHELRTPVTAIRASVETLRSIDWAKETRAAAKFLDVVDRHSKRMEALIHDLFDLSRIESGAARFEPESLSVPAIIKELHASFAEALAAKPLHWEDHVAQGCDILVANPELLRLVLHNLVDNAIRFTDPGGHVQVSAGSQDRAIAFQVADDGCGITPQEQNRVFERFYQVQRARSGPDRGTGLGLSIVRHAAVALHAKVELQSELGHGTRVTVTIPQPV